MRGFVSNNYFSLINQTDAQILAKIETGLRFQYADIRYDTFKKSYREAGWLPRKVWAIPYATFSLVVKNIICVASALIYAAQPHNHEKLKVSAFTIVRNCQASLGWALTLFHDTLGAYHIEESEFHECCYEYFMERHFVKNHPDVQVVKKQCQQQIEAALKHKEETLKELSKQTAEADKTCQNVVEEMQKRHEQKLSIIDAESKRLDLENELHITCVQLRLKIAKKEAPNYSSREIEEGIKNLEQLNIKIVNSVEEEKAALENYKNAYRNVPEHLGEPDNILTKEIVLNPNLKIALDFLRNSFANANK